MSGPPRPAFLLRGCLYGVLALNSGAPLPAAKPIVRTLAADVADVTERACFALTSGKIDFSRGGPKHDMKAEARQMETLGLVSGINNKTYNMLGTGGGGLIDQSIIAERANGEARIILAIGGRVPGCRTILAVKDIGKTETELVGLLQSKSYGWRSYPGKAPAQGSVRKISFIRRDGAGKAYLLNLLIPTVTNSDVKLLTTINLIPPHVVIPQGY